MMTEAEAKKILEQDPGDLLTGDQHREYGRAEGYLEGLESECEKSRELASELEAVRQLKQVSQDALFEEQKKSRELEDKITMLEVQLNEHNLKEHGHVDCCDSKVHAAVFKESRRLEERVQEILKSIRYWIVNHEYVSALNEVDRWLTGKSADALADPHFAPKGGE